MADREYVWLRDVGWSKPVGLVKHMAVVATKVVSGRGPFTLTQDGDAICSDVSRFEVLQRYRKAISHRELASTFRIRKGNGDVVVTGRACKPAPDEVDTNGNKHSDEFWTWVVNTYPQYHPRFAGSYVCKHIAGSSSMSQHSYGNAVDIFFDTIGHQDRVYDDIKHGKCPVPVAHAISQRSIWEPGSGEHFYSGDYHAHLHTDYSPQYSGSCGVRG